MGTPSFFHESENAKYEFTKKLRNAQKNMEHYHFIVPIQWSKW